MAQSEMAQSEMAELAMESKLAVGNDLPLWPIGGRRPLMRDIAVVIFATLVAALLCVQFDVSEAMFHWTRRFEWLQFDELPAVLLVLACGFVWFAARRYREAGAILAQQRTIDARLSAALQENRCLAQQYVSVQELERKNLARELHDELGQYLNAIKIDAVSMRNAQSSDLATIDATATAIVRSIDHVYGVVAELIRRLRPVALDDLGLVAAIEHCIDQWQRRMPTIRVQLAIDGDLGGLDEQTNLTVYRLTQESLTNAAKHADARRIEINLSRENSGGNSGGSTGSEESTGKIDAVVVHIADDGIGADLTAPRRGFGLVSMRERVEMQGGKFAVRSSLGQGFVLTAHIPCRSAPN
jgi:signal transduction histidine kinase